MQANENNNESKILEEIIKSFKEQHGRKPTKKELKLNLKKHKKAEAQKNKIASISNKEIQMMQIGSNIVVTLTNRGMGFLQRGFSFPIDMIQGDKKMRFVFMSQEVYLEKSKEFIEQSDEIAKQREELESDVNNLTEKITNDRTD